MNTVTNPIYAVRDLKANAYQAPFTSINDDTASRFFRFRILPNETGPASDFSLFRIGVFDFESGMLTADSAPVFLETGVDAESGR